MKKLKLLLSTFLGLTSVGIIAPITTSCTTITNNANNFDLNLEIKNARKNLILEQSAIDLNNLIEQSLIIRNNSLLTYEEITKKVIVNKDNFLYKKLEENDLNNDFEEETKKVIYQSYLEEFSNDENNARCGKVVTKHFWTAVGWRIAGMLLFSLSKIWWGVQLVPAIVNLIQNYDASGFIGLSFDLPDFVFIH
ncbi:MAG: hypothetical protein K2I36_01625 [Ureaplasma sp.]|nr:hypothetical protein [Ureaplasma sp.]